VETVNVRNAHTKAREPHFRPVRKKKAGTMTVKREPKCRPEPKGRREGKKGCRGVKA